MNVCKDTQRNALRLSLEIDWFPSTPAFFPLFSMWKTKVVERKRKEWSIEKGENAKKRKRRFQIGWHLLRNEGMK